jgi:hypothetical protein
MGVLVNLVLCNNKISDAGMILLSEAISKGSMTHLKAFLLSGNSFGNAAPLKAGCEKRGIVSLL